ncbi:Putative ribonuclease H protein At1g65750 [Linum perenne]
MSPPADVHGDDVWSWDDETNKNFSIRSAYKLITKTDGAPTSTNWKQVWNWRCPNKIRYFMWLATHGRLLTNEERRRRNIAANGNCPCCSRGAETTSHVLRECSFVAALQFKLGLVTETWGRIPAESCERWPSCVCDQFGHFFYNKCRASNLTCLNLAWDSGYRKVCVQTDSHVVVALLILMILQFNTTMLLR